MDGDKGGAKPAPTARIGDLLVERGLISKDQLEVAFQEKAKSNKLLGELLVELGFITEQALSAVLAESSGYQRVVPGATVVEAEALNLLPKEAAQRYRAFPVSFDGKTLRLAMADIYDVLAIDKVKRFFPAGTNVAPLVCSDTEVQKAIDQYYGHELSIEGVLKELESLESGEDEETQYVEQMEGGYLHPLVRLVNALLLDAIKTGASDVHFEPEGNFLRLRYRIDGEMTQIRTLHKRHWAAACHRIKLMGGMNIADRLNPQDGRFTLEIGNRKVDFRASSLPTIHGENVVLRILDKSQALVTIDKLGYTQHNFALIKRMVQKPEGIIIVTGPTGSGKTTTLYAMMAYINSLDVNIMTLEDPVEYELALIRQAQVREGSSLSFSEGIRTLLRQDPDIILVGEVRDSGTATMALRAAMTGHQVYTTLHTNDAAGCIPRLLDLGLKPNLMAGNVIGIIAQRLVRKLCDDCKEMRAATEDECRLLAVDPANPPQIAHPKGCDNCRKTGYKGRIAVSEILPFNDEVDALVIEDAPLPAIKKAARGAGFVPMVDDATAKVLEGRTSLKAAMNIVDFTNRLEVV
ncbi:MAG: type II/IV secretion system protein [Rhodospirillaceae bacterium]|nr:type II/IV secretion system protein [Rhodospirillaceae bacterium]